MKEILRGAAIPKAEGKLGVLIPGMGAVTTTLIAGTLSARKGIARPIGSLTQMGTLRIGKRTENNNPLIKDFVSLTDLNDVAFGCWDIFNDTAYESALNAGVLERKDIEPVADELRAIKPMSAVFNKEFVKNLDGPNVKKGATKMDLAEGVMKDIESFKKKNKCKRLVMAWAASTEAYRSADGKTHKSLANFEKGLKANAADISPSQIYAYAALKMGVPYANGAPHVTTDNDALMELAADMGMPICGKDFKTGQTLMKSILAPGFRARLLGVSGWFSTNILGNRDGEVLDDPESFKSKEVSKLGVLDTILQPEVNPELYSDMYHKVRINYYPPRGDNKESWDNIDIFGWMNYPMQIKINFLCRDSILAAPVLLDIILFLDLAQRAKMSGIQEWMSFYFKAPQHPKDRYPENDLFVQKTKLKNTLRWLMEKELITHLGQDYDE